MQPTGGGAGEEEGAGDDEGLLNIQMLWGPQYAFCPGYLFWHSLSVMQPRGTGVDVTGTDEMGGTTQILCSQ